MIEYQLKIIMDFVLHYTLCGIKKFGLARLEYIDMNSYVNSTAKQTTYNIKERKI